VLLPALPSLASDAVSMYGNIEDLLVSATMVTPTGVITRPCNVPRTSTGPNINEMIIGSEGAFGFVSEAVFRIRPLPDSKEYLGFLFPSFEHGCAAMRDVAYRFVVVVVLVVLVLVVLVLVLVVY
jgi:FAD/FMN-containing dehydrogenase